MKFERKFKIGDKVRQRPEYCYNEFDNGIFTVVEIFKRPKKSDIHGLFYY